MTAKEALSRAREILDANNIEDAPLECEILLRHVLGITRVQLYQGINQKLVPEQEEAFWRLIERRLSHEPTAYITGHCEFYGLDFYVDTRVLIPRSDTELLVQEALKLAARHSAKKRRPYLIAEAGTGSGAIAIALAQHLPQAKIYASDISVAALEVAAINCQRHIVEKQVELLFGDLLEMLPEPVDLIVANLPYIRDNEMAELSPEIRLFEPRTALAGGEDGLDKVRQLCRKISDKLHPDGCLLLEVGLGQSRELATFLRNLYPLAKIKVIPDWSGIDRVVTLTLPSSSGILFPASVASHITKPLSEISPHLDWKTSSTSLVHLDIQFT
ncbi:peptide chain release factor N(5)-glutamine methyltransferase [Chloroflexota bacterium]